MGNDEDAQQGDGLDDEPLPGLDDPSEDEPPSGGDSSPPGNEQPYATVEEALRIPERTDEDAPESPSDSRPEPIPTPRPTTRPSAKIRSTRPRPAKRARKSSRRRRDDYWGGMSYEEQVRDADEAIAVPGRGETANEQPAPPAAAESHTRSRLIRVGGPVAFVTIIAIGAAMLRDGGGDDDAPASDGDAAESSEPAAAGDEGGGEDEDISSADPVDASAADGDSPSTDTDDLIGFVGGGSGFNMEGDELLAENDAAGASEQFEMAAASYQAAIDGFGDVEDADVAAMVADAHNGKGFALERLGRAAEAMESYQATEDTYGSRSEPEIQSAVAFAMYSRATLLAADGQTDAASALFMTVIERYSTSEDEGVRLWADLANSSLSFL